MPFELYSEIRSTVTFEYSKSVDGLGEFMNSLPLQLKFKLARELHKDVQNFDLFKNVKEKSFLSYIGHRLAPRLVAEKDWLYQECDEMLGIYFIKDGTLAFVLTNQDNAIYGRAGTGDVIGFEDFPYALHADEILQDSDVDPMDCLNVLVTRKFTVITTSKVHALELSIVEVRKIQHEFPSVAISLYKHAERHMLELLLKRTKLQNKLAQQMQDQSVASNDDSSK